MASYATVPAADLESEATLLNSKPKTKTSLLVGGVAAAAFVCGLGAEPAVGLHLSGGRGLRQSGVDIAAPQLRSVKAPCS